MSRAWHWLGACALALVMPLALAADAPDVSSGYVPAEGQPFFLLSDTTYGPNDNATVRLEVPGRNLTTVSDYGGVDIRLYRVPQPLEFLKKQKNLHRVDVSAQSTGPGVGNTLTALWNNWYKSSRYTWRQIFSQDAKKAVTAAAPELKTSPTIATPPTFKANPQFKPLAGFELMQEFRYPVHQAKPIQPPKDLKLDGSSSEFISAPPGNVFIPLGQLKPGLYLVEGLMGKYRAVTLLFVADTVMITKISSGELLAWTASRGLGRPVADVDVVWTDGIGVLQSGKTDKRGVTVFRRDSPEATYVIGRDPSGGVFISENFYYDSEIYNAKLYAYTDRPLYRPGDAVNLKIVGRNFVSARKSEPVAKGDVEVQVFDPNGAPVTKQRISLDSAAGADLRFVLPDAATAGGYEVRFSYQDDLYAAAFRVAEYQKPHFEITVVPDKADFKTGDKITGKLQLKYPDGKPVKNATVELSARAQQLTMVDGDFRYAGQFPLKLSQVTLKSDGDGVAAYTLPAADAPSRYSLTAMATDGAAYRVKITREILIERSQSTYRLSAARQFSNVGQPVDFAIKPEGDAAAKPATWEWVRQEDRSKQNGKLDNAGKLSLSFVQPGSYTVMLRDEGGNLLAAAPHWVAGGTLAAPTGSINIVLDRARYNPGDTAEALITFPEPVDDALLTLERDKVEASALLSAGDSWVKPAKVSATQFRARIPVTEDYGPNITFSVAYVKGGRYVFQNQGLAVTQAKIDVQLKTAKAVYLPGETVQVEVTTRLAGKPVPARLTVGVVDEMIYVLQPEIAPDIFDFFYHPRRNNVRTGASLNFISYDLAMPKNSATPPRGSTAERNVKLLERPRRDNIDTAAWEPNLVTDEQGKVSFKFTMPDGLTRWRITARAMSADGVVGQQVNHVRSDKPFFVKWTAPNWLREGDNPQATLAVFNQTGGDAKVDLQVTAGKHQKTVALDLKPGINFATLEPAQFTPGAPVQLSLRQSGKEIDKFETTVRRETAHWRSTQSQTVALGAALSLPKDASQVRVSVLPAGTQHFARVVDDLIEYPYGCVEQTASRLIPATLALRLLASEPGRNAAELRNRVYTQRLRLAYMAGPEAKFGWWGQYTADDPFLTAYAYYADWNAARTLGISLPDDHGQRLVTFYSKDGLKLPLWHRALYLWWMGDMGLPVQTLVGGLLADLDKLEAGKPGKSSAGASAVLAEGGLSEAFTLVLAAQLVEQYGGQLPEGMAGRVKSAADSLRDSKLPLARALLALSRKDSAVAEDILADVRLDMATMDRAMTLIWLQKALSPSTGVGAEPALSGPWRKQTTAAGGTVYHWSGDGLPTTLKADDVGGKWVAVVRYQGVDGLSKPLPAKLSRKLYRLTQQQGLTFGMEEVKPGTPFSSNDLYLDEVTLDTPETMRYGIVEIPLPPGAQIEGTTWGMKLASGGDPQPMERARYQSTPFGYAVPLDGVSGNQVVRHLLRFGQKGRYGVPAARYYRMYQPELKSVEEGPAVRTWEVK